MNKKSIELNKIFIITSILFQNSIPLEKVSAILSNKNCWNQYSFLKTENIVIDFNCFNEKEQSIILNDYIKSIYAVYNYDCYRFNHNFILKQRQISKCNSVITSCKIKMFNKYLTEGINIKDKYKSFMQDFKQYILTIEIINDLKGNEEDKETVDFAIQQRIVDSEYLIATYPEFDLSDTELRSVSEDDLLYNFNTNKAA